jgi:hypothetical protein
MTHARAPRARTLDPRPVSVRTPSVLVMSHSHPKLTRGGAEISALALFRGIKERGARAWFLGCGGIGSEQRLGAALTQPYGADDYVYTPAAPFDYFKFANPDPHFPRALAELVAELRPDIVHAHHYARFGVEMLALIKRVSPTFASATSSPSSSMSICSWPRASFSPSATLPGAFRPRASRCWKTCRRRPARWRPTR